MHEYQQRLRGGQFAVWLASKVQSINFALTARLHGALSPDQLRAALDKLRRKYPALSMRLTETAHRQVVLIPDPDLEIPVRLVERGHSEQWADEVAAELGQPFDLLNDAPLRLVWLRGEDASELSFICPHALADGLSVVYLIRDFLEFLEHPEATVQPLPPALSMSDGLPDFPGKRSLVWQFKIKAAAFRYLLKLAPQHPLPPRKQANYQLLNWELTPAQTAALIQRSRSENTTVHAALSAAFLRAFGELRGNGWKRRLQSPLSLRERLNPPVGEAFGLYVNLVELSVDCAPQRDFWAVAREIKQSLARCAEDRHVFRSLIEGNVMMDRLGAVVAPEFVAQSFLTVAYDLSITNLGRLNLPTQAGALQLDAVYGPSLGGNPEDIVLGVSTVGGRMAFSLAFTQLKLSRSQAEWIKERALQHLETAIGTQR
ncbi:MAG: hypothetical protein JW892_06415 [Anaerolineae bacterium]|nr:hypothetical protein [Anaerolineae bacterium]